MKINQFVAYAIILFIAIAIITGILEPASEDAWYTLSGLGMITFGIWASVLLLKKEEKEEKK